MHDAPWGEYALLRREVRVLIDALLAKLHRDDQTNLLAFLSLSAEHQQIATRLRINRRGDVFLAVRTTGAAA